MRAFFTTIIFTVVMLVASTAVSQAFTPTAINFQGRLTDASGTAVPDGTYSVVFTIYNAAITGTAKWTEAESVTTAGGLFAVRLGSVTPITDSVFNGLSYLGVKVGTDPELRPRTALVTAPYAFRISTVDGSTGGAISGNINLDNSTATTGNILKGGVPFISTFGSFNTFIGLNAGNLATYGYDNTACGTSALQNLSNGAVNTASGAYALYNNTFGSYNTASGFEALYNDTTGTYNTAFGCYALQHNGSGTLNTAIGHLADVSTGSLTNATAIGARAVVNASNKIRFGDANVTVIEGQVAYTFTSDRNQKENFRPVDGDDVLRKIRGLSLTSWNYKKQDPSRFRHYGPVAQEFYAAFGHDAVGRCGDSTSINSGDETGILMVAVQTLEKDKEQMKAENAVIRAENVELKSRLEKVEMALSKLAESVPAANKELVAK